MHLRMGNTIFILSYCKNADGLWRSVNSLLVVFCKIIFARLLKNGRMQVKLCEIPFAGAPEILRSEAYSDVRCNDEGPARRQGKRRRCLPAVGRSVFEKPYLRFGAPTISTPNSLA